MGKLKADAAAIERRQSERAEKDADAEARFADGTRIACRLKDLSDGGARLDIGQNGSDAFVRSVEFTLVIPGEEVRRVVRVAWQSGGEIGVAFVGSGGTQAG